MFSITRNLFHPGFNSLPGFILKIVKNRIPMQRGHAVDAWKRMRRSTQRGLDVITRRRGRKVLHELLQLVKTLQGCPVEPPNELVHPEAEPYGPDQESVGPGCGLGAPRAAEPGGALHGRPGGGAPTVARRGPRGAPAPGSSRGCARPPP